MNKLIIIGNGFDLAHGLETRYSDFLLSYLNKAFMALRNTGYFKGKLIELSATAFKPLSKFDSIRDFRDYIKGYGTLKISYVNLFFKKILDMEYDPNWVDIESKYYESLVEIYREFVFQVDKRYEYHIARSEAIRQVEDLNKHLNTIKKELLDYLNNIEIRPELAIDEIKTHFISILGEKYLGKQGNVHLLNFNYTSTAELYKTVFASVHFELNYIHGKLKDEENPIIFGYGDEMDSYYEKIERLNSNVFLNNFKSFGYSKTRNYQIFSRFIDSKPFNVYILGHSCGLSDRVLLNRIFENKNCNSVKIYYHEYKKDNKIMDDHFEKTQEISRHFKLENNGLMRDLIVPKPDSDPLIRC